MDRDDERDLVIQALRDRLSRLSEASRRINESLDFDAVLQGVLASARDLTRSRYGVFILLDDAGRMRKFFGSGMTPEQGRRLWPEPDRVRFSTTLAELRIRCECRTSTATPERWVFPSSPRP